MTNEKVKYWVEISEYDLETAEAMLQTKRYLYVAFMCHQSIEKIIKAYHSVKQSSDPAFSHNLKMLANRSGLTASLTQAYLDIISTLEPFNIESRYPAYKQQLLKILNQKRCTEILNEK